MVQIETLFAINYGDANEKLRAYQRNNPKRKIVNISMIPAEFPAGWFMTIMYEVDI